MISSSHCKALVGDGHRALYVLVSIGDVSDLQPQSNENANRPAIDLDPMGPWSPPEYDDDDDGDMYDNADLFYRHAHQLNNQDTRPDSDTEPPESEEDYDDEDEEYEDDENSNKNRYPEMQYRIGDKVLGSMTGGGGHRGPKGFYTASSGGKYRAPTRSHYNSNASGGRHRSPVGTMVG